MVIPCDGPSRLKIPYTPANRPAGGVLHTFYCASIRQGPTRGHVFQGHHRRRFRSRYPVSRIERSGSSAIERIRTFSFSRRMLTGFVRLYVPPHWSLGWTCQWERLMSCIIAPRGRQTPIASFAMCRNHYKPCRLGQYLRVC